MSLGSASLPKLVKQRAACNRCHELKSRCTQSSSETSNCDRCQRLGIKCVYSAKSPLGRPKAATTRRNNAEDARSDRRRDSDNRPGTSETASTLDDTRSEDVVMSLLSDDCFASITSGWQNGHELDIGSPGWSALGVHSFQPSHDFSTIQPSHNRANFLGKRKNSYLPDAPSTSSLGSIVDLPSPNFEGESFDIVELLSGAKDPLGYTNDENQRMHTADITHQNAISTTSTCESLDRGFDNNQSEPSTIKRLLDLQLQLQNLSASHISPNEDPKSESSGGLAEVLFAVRSLTKILSDVAGRRAKSASQPSRMAANAGHGGRGPEERSPSPLGEEDGLVILHALTCYIYLLQMFEPMVIALKKQCRNSVTKPADVLAPALSLGSFSLASQPELNVQVTLNLIHLMFQRLHHSIQSLKLEKPHFSLGTGTGSTEGNEGRGTNESSSMVDAALVAIKSMHLMEASVLRKLENSGRDWMMDECFE